MPPATIHMLYHPLQSLEFIMAPDVIPAQQAQEFVRRWKAYEAKGTVDCVKLDDFSEMSTEIAFFFKQLSSVWPNRADPRLSSYWEVQSDNAVRPEPIVAGIGHARQSDMSFPYELRPAVSETRFPIPMAIWDSTTEHFSSESHQFLAVPSNPSIGCRSMELHHTRTRANFVP